MVLVILQNQIALKKTTKTYLIWNKSIWNHSLSGGFTFPLFPKARAAYVFWKLVTSHLRIFSVIFQTHNFAYTYAFCCTDMRVPFCIRFFWCPTNCLLTKKFSIAAITHSRFYSRFKYKCVTRNWTLKRLSSAQWALQI